MSNVMESKEKSLCSENASATRDTLQTRAFQLMLDCDEDCKSIVDELIRYDEWLQTANKGDVFSTWLDSRFDYSLSRQPKGLEDLYGYSDGYNDPVAPECDIEDIDYSCTPEEIMKALWKLNSTKEDKIAALQNFMAWLDNANGGDVYVYNSVTFHLAEDSNIKCPCCGETIKDLSLCDADKIWTDNGDHLFVNICPHCEGMIWKDSSGIFRRAAEADYGH